MQSCPALATRHECPLKYSTAWQSAFHNSGNGKPRSKNCTYCRGQFRIEQGWHGVFAWDRRDIYPPASAIRLFTSPTAAQRYIDKHAQLGYVIRWVSAPEETP